MSFDINKVKEMQENNKSKKLNEEAEKTQSIRKYVNSIINNIKNYIDSETFEDELQSYFESSLNSANTDELYIEIYAEANYNCKWYKIRIKKIYNSQFYISWITEDDIQIPKQYIKEIFSEYWDMVVEKLRSLGLQANRPRPDLDIPNDWFCYKITLSIIEK